MRGFQYFSTFSEYFLTLQNDHASCIIVLVCVVVQAPITVFCTGTMSRGHLDSIHWVGIFLLSSENHIFLTHSFQSFDQLLYHIWSFFPAQVMLFSYISRSLAEFSRIPIVVTNQVRSQSRDESCQFPFQGIMS